MEKEKRKGDEQSADHTKRYKEIFIFIAGDEKSNRRERLRAITSGSLSHTLWKYQDLIQLLSFTTSITFWYIFWKTRGTPMSRVGARSAKSWGSFLISPRSHGEMTAPNRNGKQWRERMKGSKEQEGQKKNAKEPSRDKIDEILRKLLDVT